MNRRILIGAAAPMLALALGSGVAWGSAANKTNPNAGRSYDSQADSSAGIDLLGGVGGPTLIQVAESEGSSDTSGSGGSGSSTGESSANALNVADVIVIGQAECASAGVDNEGAQSTEASDALIDESDEDGAYDIEVLSASCSSRSVQSNTSSTTAESAVLDASLDGVGSVTVLGSSSETTTTSGQSRSSSSLTVLRVADGDGVEVIDVSCEESASANRGETTESDDACGPLAAATASHTSG